MTPLQQFVQNLAIDLQIPERFIQASNHKYACRCESCLLWWSSMPPEDEESEMLDDEKHGPFTWKEIRDYREKQEQESKS